MDHRTFSPRFRHRKPLQRAVAKRVGLVLMGSILSAFTLPVVLPLPQRDEGLTLCYPILGPVQRFNADLSGLALADTRVHEAAHATQCRRDGAIWHFVRGVFPSQRLAIEAEAFCAEARFGVANGVAARLEYARVQDELREMSWFRRFSSEVLNDSLASQCPTIAAAANREEAVWQARLRRAQAPSQQQGATSPVGTWRGTSVCLVRPSACHDEIVVYRITRTKTADSLMMDALKIVGGEEQDMGVISCRFTPSNQSLTCPIPQGTWQFRVRGDSLVGELRHPDNTKFRDVRTVRAPSSN